MSWPYVSVASGLVVSLEEEEDKEGGFRTINRFHTLRPLW